VNVGLLLRANRKGLGVQTQAAWANYPFARALLVLDPTRRASEYPEAFPDVPTARRDPRTARFESTAPVERFLDGLDAVFTVETLYDSRLVDLAKVFRVRTVIQGNPEFYRPEERPTNWVWPTRWMVEHLPGRVVPVPLAGDCRATAGGIDDERFVVVHPGGYRAIGDRNGTDIVLEAVRYLSPGVTLRIYNQDEATFPLPRIPPGVEVEQWAGSVPDRWAMYEGAHALAMPRRYGGLCLPALEAIEAGIVPIMPATSPNTDWPIMAMQCRKGRPQRTPFGVVNTVVTAPDTLGRAINRLAANRDALRDSRIATQEWAADNTWDALRPLYDTLWSLDEDPLPSDPAALPPSPRARLRRPAR
jgi:hypothetical protein